METLALFTSEFDNITLKIEVQNFNIGDNGDDTCWAEADFVSISEIETGGSEKPYVPTGMTWEGHRYDANELMEIVVRMYVNDAIGCEFHEVHPSLVDYRDRASSDVACSLNGRDLPFVYYDFWRNAMYKLMYATDANYYYSHSDSLLMFAADGTLVSDNNFAEDGLADSISSVFKGDEVEIWASPDLEEYKEEIVSGE